MPPARCAAAGAPAMPRPTRCSQAARAAAGGAVVRLLSAAVAALAAGACGSVEYVDGPPNVFAERDSVAVGGTVRVVALGYEIRRLRDLRWAVSDGSVARLVPGSADETSVLVQGLRPGTVRVITTARVGVGEATLRVVPPPAAQRGAAADGADEHQVVRPSALTYPRHRTTPRLAPRS